MKPFLKFAGASSARFCMLVLGFLVVAATAAQLAAQAPGGVTVFEGARLIVGDGSAPIENGTFIVSGARLTAVGRSDQVQIPAGAARVNLMGRTVMPAIIDTHTHLSVTHDALVDDLRRRAYYGIGAAMSLGLDSGNVVFQVRQETIPGAALFRTAGRGITAPEPGRTDVPYWITTEAEGRKAVQELAIQKVDIVKIWVDDRNGMFKKLTPALYAPIIDEAHKHGLRVTAHIVTLEDAKGLLRAGIDGFAHGVRDKDVDDEFIALVKARPSFVLVPNLPDRGVKTDYAWLSESLPADEVKKLQDGAAADRPPAQQVFSIQARNLAKLSSAGVKIALGTDGNTPWAPHTEMEDMVASGMTPAQVLVAATRNSADFMLLSDTGTLAAGKSADFLVLDANPLENITNTRRISRIYLRGAAIDRAALKATFK